MPRLITYYFYDGTYRSFIYNLHNKQTKRKRESLILLYLVMQVIYDGNYCHLLGFNGIVEAK